MTDTGQKRPNFTVILRKLGGVVGVRALVDDFYNKALESDDLKHFFESVNMKTLRKHQEDFIVSALSGTAYDGQTLYDAHISLVRRKGLEAKHINIFIGIVDGCLQQRGADDELRAGIQSFLGDCRDAIVSSAD